MFANQVFAGADKESVDRHLSTMERLMQMGVAGLWIPLNGGSESRAAEISYWKEYARDRNIGFQTNGGCVVIVGGPCQ